MAAGARASPPNSRRGRVFGEEMCARTSPFRMFPFGPLATTAPGSIPLACRRHATEGERAGGGRRPAGAPESSLACTPAARAATPALRRGGHIRCAPAATANAIIEAALQYTAHADIASIGRCRAWPAALDACHFSPASVIFYHLLSPVTRHPSSVIRHPSLIIHLCPSGPAALLHRGRPSISYYGGRCLYRPGAANLIRRTAGQWAELREDI